MYRSAGRVPFIVVLVGLLFPPGGSTQQLTWQQIAELPETRRNAILYDMADRADAANLERLIREAEDTPIAGPAITIFVRAYVDLDPQAALDYALNFEGHNRQPILGVLIRHWARTDLDAAIAAAKELPPELSGSARRTIAAEYRGADPEFREELHKRLEVSPQQRAREDMPNPEEVFEQALALPPGPERDQAIRGTLFTWTRIDPAAALAATEALERHEAESARSVVLDTWARTDPQGLLQALPEVSNAQQREQLLGTALGVLARDDPALALDQANALDTRSARIAARYSVLGGISASDPMLAAELYAQLPPNERPTQLVGQLLIAMIRQDADAAMAWAESVDGERGYTWVVALDMLAREDPDRALELLSGYEPSPELTQSLGRVLSQVARSDPERAAGYVPSLPPGDMKRSVAMRTASQWARTDPAATLEWVKTLDEDTQVAAIREAGGAILKADPELAFTPLEQFHPAARTDWIAKAANAYAREDPLGAVDWLEPYSSDEQYPRWIEGVVTVAAYDDPALAMEIASNLSTREERSRAQLSVLGVWAERDGAAAARWVELQPPGEQRSHMVRRIANTWFRKSPSATLQWVESRTDPEDRELGFVGLAESGSADSEQILEFIQRVQSAEWRENLLAAHIISLVRADPDRAQQILDESNLRADLQANLQEQIDKERERRGWVN